MKIPKARRPKTPANTRINVAAWTNRDGESYTLQRLRHHDRPAEFVIYRGHVPRRGVPGERVGTIDAPRLRDFVRTLEDRGYTVTHRDRRWVR